MFCVRVCVCVYIYIYIYNMFAGVHSVDFFDTSVLKTHRFQSVCIYVCTIEKDWMINRK